MNDVTLENDIFTLGYCIFLQSGSMKRMDNIVKKCVFTFFIQISLFGLLLVGFRAGQDEVVSVFDTI